MALTYRAKALSILSSSANCIWQRGRSISFSSVNGPTHPPLEYRTLPVFFREEIAGKHAERPALICRQERSWAHGGPPSRNMGVSSHLAWDFYEFDRHIQAVARGLVSLGVKKGDRVGVIMGNNSAYALLQWASASIGAILVTLNPAYRLHELVEALNVVGVAHLFVVPRVRSSRYVRGLSAAYPDLRCSAPGNIQAASLPSLRNFIVVNDMSDPKEYLEEVRDIRSVIDFREMLVWREAGPEQRHVKDIVDSHHFDEVINLQFTSGTTGKPKAVSLTHLNLLNNGLSNARCMRLTPSDVLFLGNLAAWSHGACVVYPAPIFNPPAIVDALVQDRCTALHGVPTHFLGVLSEVQSRQAAGEKVDLTSLRTGVAAGSPIPIDLMQRLINKLNLIDLTNAYGMTETSPVSFQTTPADPIIKRVETVGKVQPHVRAKVVDLEGKTVPVGTPGEVCVTGYLLQKGYWENEEQTKKVMRPDPEDPTIVWMHTGDEGIMDEDGYLKNSRYGEVVGVWIVLEPGTTLTREEVRRVVADGMNPQNTPAWVWFIGEPGVSQELPKTASGKIMKHILRDWSKELARNGAGKVA
ncbi:hypothetical protein ID866_6070 [Astraeus odoratus]|nr:hypothetical protein ID866_6070 [Astraeus odoratus]